jgi:hypothetical protein
VVIGDATFALTGAAASALALRFYPDRLQGVLLALVFANVAGAAALFVAGGGTARLNYSRRARYFYFGLSRRLVWSLYSVTAAILQGQGLSFLVVGFAGPAAFAPIAAMMAIFAPLRIFSMSLASMLQPEVSRLAAAGDVAGWRKLRQTWTLRAIALALLYGDIGLGVIPRLHLRSVEGQPVLFVAVLAWALFAVVLAYLLPRILLEVRMRFREIAIVTTVGALSGLAVTATLLRLAPPGYCIFGAVLGESLVAVATWRLAERPFAGARRSASSRLRPSTGETCEVGRSK